MKKIFLVLAVLSLTAAAATAQPIRLGVKAGLSMLSTDVRSSYEIDFANPQAGESGERWDEFKSKEIGWQAGLMVRISLPLTNLYVQPELVYNHASYRATWFGDAEKLSHGTIELPVLLGFKILFLNAHVGPTFTLANMTGGDIYKIDTPDVGFQAGVGVTMGKVTLDVRYQGYFAKKWDDIDFRDMHNKLKTNDGYWGASIGYFF